MKVVYCGIIPYCFKNGIYYLFLSEERHVPKKWCGFGGGIETGEDIITCATREAWEESMGVFGSKSNILLRIKRAKYAIYSYNDNKASIQYLVEYPQKDFKKLEDNYNNVIQYLEHCQCLNNKHKAKTGCFEKIKGKWFPLADIIKAATYNLPIQKPDHYLRNLFDMSLISGKILETQDLDKFL